MYLFIYFFTTCVSKTNNNRGGYTMRKAHKTMTSGAN